MEFEPMLTPREKSPLPENVPRGVLNPRHCGSEPKHYQLSYSGPHRVSNVTGSKSSVEEFKPQGDKEGRNVEQPLPLVTASRATPQPVAPPPMTKMSNSSSSSDFWMSCRDGSGEYMCFRWSSKAITPGLVWNKTKQPLLKTKATTTADELEVFIRKFTSLISWKSFTVPIKVNDLKNRTVSCMINDFI